MSPVGFAVGGGRWRRQEKEERKREEAFGASRRRMKCSELETGDSVGEGVEGGGERGRWRRRVADPVGERRREEGGGRSSGGRGRRREPGVRAEVSKEEERGSWRCGAADPAGGEEEVSGASGRGREEGSGISAGYQIHRRWGRRRAAGEWQREWRQGEEEEVGAG